MICLFDADVALIDNSTIENNYANSDTGGINLDGSELTIRGKNKSKIKNNKGEGYGGGIYFWNDDTKITADKLGDLTIDGNSADEGGGIYINKENNEISNLVITNNNANKGGGIYIANDYTTINNCTITDNKTHGVYVENECDKEMCLKGATVIKGNSGGNLKIYDGTTFFSVDRNDKMNIFIGYVNNPSTADGYRISSNVSVDTSNQFTADDDAYTVAYTYRDRDGDDGRRLFYIKKSDQGGDRGRQRVNPAISTITTQNIHAYTDQTEVYAGGYTADEGGSGTKYELRRIYGHHTSSGDKDFPLYYTDGFFFEDPVIYNDHLATASIGLASSGAYLDGYKYMLLKFS